MDESTARDDLLAALREYISRNEMNPQYALEGAISSLCAYIGDDEISELAAQIEW